MRMTSTLKGDIFGGITAAIIALPLAIAFGVLTLSPLGPEWASRGALAGLYGAIFAGFFASLLGGTPAQVTGPTGPMTVVMTSVVASLMAHPTLANGHPHRDEIVLALAFLCVLFGGAGQIILSALRLGSLVKFIPYPVIAGFMNGIAVIILVGQLAPFVGLPAGTSLLDLSALRTGLQPLTAVIGVFTFAVVWWTPRVTRAIPGSLAGLALGTALFHLVSVLFEGARLGPVIGTIPSSFPRPDFLVHFGTILAGRESGVPPGIVLDLLAPAATLAVLGAIDSLLTSVVADSVTRTRHDSNRELVGQGVGNMVAAVFGGLPSAGATVRTLVNIDAGGRSRISGMVHSLVLLVVLVAQGPMASRIPMVVLAAILGVTAVRMVDEWSRSLIWKLTGTAQQRREIAINLAVVVLVMTVTVTVDLMLAVAIGLVAACLLFVEKMSRSVIGSVHHGGEVRSRRLRSSEETGILDARGETVRVFGLQGPLFFGSADQLASAVEREGRGARFIVLEMRTVSEIDSSGARILLLMAETLQDEGRFLLLSHLIPGRARHGFLQDMGVVTQVGEDRIFVDTDAALEWVEERLLDEAGHAPEGLEVPLEDMDIAQGLTPDEVAVLRQVLQRKEFPRNSAIVRRGEQGDSLFILARGTASTRITDEASGLVVRLATFEPGSVFGEMALLEEKPRAGDVTADQDVLVHVLGAADLQELRDRHPRVAAHLLWNIGRELSARLRSTTLHLLAVEGAVSR